MNERICTFSNLGLYNKSDRMSKSTIIMPLTVSDDAVVALNPVNLSSTVDYNETKGVITSDGTTIQITDIILATQLNEGSYLLLTFSQDEQSSPPDESTNPFHLAAFRAPTLPHEILSAHLVSSTAPEALDPSANINVIVSTKSGTGLSQRFHDAVLRPLLDILNLPYELTVTSSANCVREFARQKFNSLNSSDPTKQTVILLSGDGGIVDLLNGIKPSPTNSLPTIALIPLGTGNALFHSLHKPHYTTPSPCSHLHLALRALFHGRTTPLPTFDAIFPPGSHLVQGNALTEPVTHLTGAIVASYGFHAQLVWESDTPEYRVHGAARFGMVAGELLKSPHSYLADVSTSSGSLQSEKEGFNYVLATLVSNLEKTFAISPASKPLDGVLRLVWFGGRDGEGVMDVMKAAYAGGGHVGMQGVGYEEVGEELSVTSWENEARWRKVCVDGTIVEIPRGEAMVVKRSQEARVKVIVLDA